MKLLLTPTCHVLAVWIKPMHVVLLCVTTMWVGKKKTRRRKQVCEWAHEKVWLREVRKSPGERREEKKKTLRKRGVKRTTQTSQTTQSSCSPGIGSLLVHHLRAEKHSCSSETQRSEKDWARKKQRRSGTPELINLPLERSKQLLYMYKLLS